MVNETRTETDSLGEVEVPADAYWGSNTQRAIQNFQISDRRFPERFIRSLVIVKKACLLANYDLEQIDQGRFQALLEAIDDVLEGHLRDQFPIDVFQTGSGTQTNMNVNEVLANRANEILGQPLGKKAPVHPNDHVNMGQSSNDTIPTAMHLAIIDDIHEHLGPSLDLAITILERKMKQFEGIVKVGRTHLQDAVPIPLSLEVSVYRDKLKLAKAEIISASDNLLSVPIGGTALGTGINSSKIFSKKTVTYLQDLTGFEFKEDDNKARDIASHTKVVSLSGTLRTLALVCLKMANDIRWMGTGPRAGLGELQLPRNEPGSSMMPGKINPTQSEALIQVCGQVLGNDHAISFGEAFGSILDLNVAKPLIIQNVLDSIQLLSNGIRSFAKNCLADLKADEKRIEELLDRSLMVVTRLSPFIGYDKASEVAKTALRRGLTIRQTFEEMDLEINGNLDEILDPKEMV
ncbi:MAG: class II fumarate hydratase [Candidatus Thorarchaeota archaeon]|nr:class II fumarate hydratase [Candidatus Thorarchaeota archaeon]